MRSAAVPLIAFSALIASAPAHAADIPAGTHILLRMMNSINTRTAAEGNQVYLQTAAPVAINDQIVIPAGAYVQGTISHVRRSGRVKGRAELGIHLDTMTLPSGKTVKIAPRLESVDSNESGQQVNSENQIAQAPQKERDAARIAITAGSGAAIGGIAGASWHGAGIGAAAGSAVGLATAMLTRGSEVELRQGTTLDVALARDLRIE
jgi:hypothetical protein